MTGSDKQPVTWAATLTGSVCNVRIPSVGPELLGIEVALGVRDCRVCVHPLSTCA